MAFQRAKGKLFARLPRQELACRHLRSFGHLAWIAGTLFCSLPQARLAGLIRSDEYMMSGLVIRPKLDRAHIAPFLHGILDHEVPVNILALRW